VVVVEVVVDCTQQLFQGNNLVAEAVKPVAELVVAVAEVELEAVVGVGVEAGAEVVERPEGGAEQESVQKDQP